MRSARVCLVLSGLALLAACDRRPDAPSAAGSAPASAPAPAAEAAYVALPEGLPPARWKQVEAYYEALRHTAPVAGLQPRAVVSIAKRWTAGSTIRVAFHGGTTDLHRKIENAAAVWTQYANLGFDFGYNSRTRTYRSWSPSDKEYGAEIRIGFDAGGYWSCVGTDSVHEACARAGQQSMNFARFDRALPSGWAGTVMHEFGHAIGLAHEHQNPRDSCEPEFLWNDEPGYAETRDVPYQQFIPDAQGRRPGIYRVLAGPLNFWDRDTIDRNMKKLPDSQAYDAGPFDPDSIMKYAFPAWQYVSGARSRCYSERNDVLSSGDRVSIAKAYPREMVGMREGMRLQLEALKEIRHVTAQTDADRKRVEERINKLKDAIW